MRVMLPNSEPTERRTRGSGQRTYFRDGKEYPSSTTILQVINKPALVNWAAKKERQYCKAVAQKLYDNLSYETKLSKMSFMLTMEQHIDFMKAHEKEKRRAGDIGTEVHNRIEWEIKDKLHLVEGEAPPLSTPEAVRAFDKFVKWEQAVSFEPISIERIIWSDQFGYAGTVDWIAYVNGVLTVGDWKTGKYIYQEAWLQVASYCMAAIEEGILEPPLQMCVVRLPKETTDPVADVEIKGWDDVQEAFETFKGAQILFNGLGGIKESWNG